jgi:mRNA-degrading endonuclease RelE of RelBE toxin-antitoxin system
MEIVFESTKDFEKELARFSESERKIIVDHLNQYAQLFLTDKPALFRKLRRLSPVKLINDYESTLYSLKVSDSIRIILTIDEDTIFEQVIFTLFRVVNKSLASQAYNEVTQLIYADFMVTQIPSPQQHITQRLSIEP